MLHQRPQAIVLALFSAMGLHSQNPAMNTNTAFQMQQQQFQAQRMFQMQQQLQRTMQAQQMMMQQQQQMQRQMAAQQAAQRGRQEAQLELAARRSPTLPPLQLAKPSKEAWKVLLGQTDIYPAFDGNRLIGVVEKPRRLQSLAIESGRMIWEVALADKPSLDPLLVGDCLVYATSDYELVILNADTGKEKNRIKLDVFDSYLLSNRKNHARVLFPAVEGNRLVLATFGKGKAGPSSWVYAIDLATGQTQWRFEFLGGVDATPGIKDEAVLVAGGGRVLSLNLSTGKQNWEYLTGGEGEVLDGPVLTDRGVFTCGGNLFALNLAKGNKLWTVPYKGQFSPQGEGERILFTEFRGSLFLKKWMVALDAKTGEKTWDMKASGARFPWIQEGKVYCNVDEQLMALDLISGKSLWNRALKEAPALPISVFGESLFVVNRDGGQSLLQSLNLKNGEVTWGYTYAHKPSEGMLLLTSFGFVFPGEKESLVLLN